MATRDVVTLNETTPQLEVAQSSDTYRFPRPIETAAGEDLTIKLSDAAGARKLLIKDSNDVTLASINSDGVITGTAIYGTQIRDDSSYYFSSNSPLRVSSSYGFAWSGVAAPYGTYDLYLHRGGAGILAQYMGTDSQALRIYNTYTDASNGEWGAFSWKTTANTLTIGPQANGTGTLRGTNYVGAFHNFSNYLALTEMSAPASADANNVRIFAQDNGSGKTQLMAIFQSGAAVQIAIEP